MYEFTKSLFKYTPAFLVTAPAVDIWNASSCGSVACEVPPYDPVATGLPSNSRPAKVNEVKVKALPSASVAVIDPAAVPSDEFSLTPDIDWLFIVGVALSCTVIVIGNVTIESTSPYP